MWIQISWLKHLSKNELQIASYIESWYVAMPSGERKKDAKCFASIETMAKALNMNESSLRTALSRMTTPDARGWRWLHERQQYVQKDRKAIMQHECGAREVQRFSTHRMQTIRTIAPQMGKVEYLWLIKEWIPYLNRTELAIASYIHGFAKISRVCWANNKQIAEHLGLTTTQISRNLKSLMRRGWLQEFPMESEEEDGIATAYDSEQQPLPLKRSKGIHRVITPFGDAPIFAQTSTAKNDTERVHEHLLQQANSLLHIEQLHSEQLHSETDHVPPLHFELDHDALEGSNTPVISSTMNGLQSFVEAQIRVSLTKLHSEYRELHSETEKLRIEIRKLHSEVQKLQTESEKLQSETPIYSQDSPLAPPQRQRRYSVPEEELTGSKHFAAAKELLEWVRLEQPDIMWHFERDVQFTGAAPDEKRSRDEMLVCTIKLLELPCVQGDVEFVKELLTKAVSNNFWKDQRNCLTPHRLLDDHDEHTKITKLEFLATKLTTQSQRVTAQKQEQQKQEISQMTAESFEEHVKKIEKARKVEIERQRQAFLASL